MCSSDLAVKFAVADLPGATLTIAPNPISVKPGASAQGSFEISEPAGQLRDLVTHFHIVTGADTIPMTFLAPEGK